MASIHWASDLSGSFGAAADWTGGVVPDASDYALLEAAGTKAYTVTASASGTVKAIETAATATLAITAGTFTAAGGTSSGDNAGTIEVAKNATLDLGGAWRGAGFVDVATGATVTVAAGDLTLKGPGGVHLAGGQIKGATAAAVLDNGGVISGFGALGAGQMRLSNLAGATIASSGASLLEIDTGAYAVNNAGTIAAEGTAGVTIAGAVNNAGVLEAYGASAAAKLTVDGAVTGAGMCVIAVGTVDFTRAFNQEVIFLSAEGTLELAHSRTYTGTVAGFSALNASAGDVLDLADIPFSTKTTTVTYSGTAEGGVLTVTDGTDIAMINFIGNYVGDRFTASLGIGGVGTKVMGPFDTSPAKAPGAGHAFVQAMAGMGAAAPAAASPGPDIWRTPAPTLGMPRTQAA